MIFRIKYLLVTRFFTFLNFISHRENHRDTLKLIVKNLFQNINIKIRGKISRLNLVEISDKNFRKSKIIQRSTSNLRPKDRVRFNRKSKSSRSIFERIQLISGGIEREFVCCQFFTYIPSANQPNIWGLFHVFRAFIPRGGHVLRVSRW